MIYQVSLNSKEIVSIAISAVLLEDCPVNSTAMDERHGGVQNSQPPFEFSAISLPENASVVVNAITESSINLELGARKETSVENDLGARKETSVESELGARNKTSVQSELGARKKTSVQSELCALKKTSVQSEPGAAKTIIRETTYHELGARRKTSATSIQCSQEIPSQLVVSSSNVELTMSDMVNAVQNPSFTCGCGSKFPR